VVKALPGAAGPRCDIRLSAVKGEQQGYSWIQTDPIRRKSRGFHFCFRRDLAVHLETWFRIL